VKKCGGELDVIEEREVGLVPNDPEIFNSIENFRSTPIIEDVPQ